MMWTHFGFLTTAVSWEMLWVIVKELQRLRVQRQTHMWPQFKEVQKVVLFCFVFNIIQEKYTSYSHLCSASRCMRLSNWCWCLSGMQQTSSMLFHLSTPWCHDPFPELSHTPCSYTTTPFPTRLTPVHSLRTPQAALISPTLPYPAPWAPHVASQVAARTHLEWDPQVAGAIFSHVAITWWLCNHVPGRPPHQNTWVLSIPTLIPSHLFPSYCRMMLLNCSAAIACILLSFPTRSPTVCAPMSCSHPCLLPPLADSFQSYRYLPSLCPDSICVPVTL